MERMKSNIERDLDGYMTASGRCPQFAVRLGLGHSSSRNEMKRIITLCGLVAMFMALPAATQETSIGAVGASDRPVLRNF